MQSRGLSPEYPAAISQALQNASAELTLTPGIRDLRDLPWCSIDNGVGEEVTSKDLDQITAGRRFGDGFTKIYVGIADVDALVPRGSPPDLQAQVNTATVYTSVKIYPMIDRSCSEDKTSLNEGEDRLAIVGELNVDKQGEVTEFRFYRALVRNHVKLSYDATSRWLENTANFPSGLRGRDDVRVSIEVQDKAAQKIKAARRRRGSLELESQQAGEAPLPKRSMELIENLMVACNHCVSTFLRTKGFPTFQRIVRKPKLWAEIREVARDKRWELPEIPEPGPLARFLEAQRAQEPENFPELSLKILRMMGRGEYVVELPDEPLIGHFGLALREYSHSTAPNRRYPDLITQRLLKALIAKEPCPYDREELDRLAAHCSDMEARANKVERQLQKSVVAQSLVEHIGETFEAVVSGINAQGTWIRLVSLGAEGKLAGRAEVGEHLLVRLASVHVEKGFLDFVKAVAKGKDHGN